MTLQQNSNGLSSEHSDQSPCAEFSHRDMSVITYTSRDCLDTASKVVTNSSESVEERVGMGQKGTEQFHDQEQRGKLVIEIPGAQEDSYYSTMKYTFMKYCTKKNGGMDIHGLSRCMHDFGLLDGRSAQESSDAIVAMFARLDIHKKNCIYISEFEHMWTKINAPRLEDIISQEDPALEQALFNAFCLWSTFGNPHEEQAKIQKRTNKEIMGSSHWTKLCRDVGFIAHGGHSPTSMVSFSDADIMFVKVKARSKRKINYSQFIDALGLLAEKLGAFDVMDIVRMVVKSKPVLNGTIVRTPTFCPSTARYNIFKRDLIVSSPPKTVIYDSARMSGKKWTRASPCSRKPGESDEERLLLVYGQYARFGHRQKAHSKSDIQMAMSDQQFSKLCRECGLINKTMPLVKIDVIFARAKKPRTTCLMFEDFLVALSIIASEQGLNEKDIYSRVCQNTAGPRINSPDGTKSNDFTFVRLHDDPLAQCGVYGRRRMSPKSAMIPT